MARDPEIREYIHLYLDVLFELYEESDPSLGEASEDGKLARARHAIEVWWRLHDKLMVWAQAHLTGHSICMHTPELTDFLNRELQTEITEDSHILEQIGLLYSCNPPDDCDPDLLRAEDLIEEFKKEAAENDFPAPGEEVELLTTTALRTLVRELLVSRSANSSYWRFELQTSLAALNEGEVRGMSSPARKKRQGQPYSLKQWKLHAIRQVYFRIGKGMKKYRALEEVGRGINQSTETLRDWEKGLRQSKDYKVDLCCCELAGRFQNELKKGHYTSIPDYEEFGSHRGVDAVDRADILLRLIEGGSLEEIRTMIAKYRQKSSGG